MTVQKIRRNSGNHNLIQPLLRLVGLPKERVNPRRYRWGKMRMGLFWTRPEGELLSILEEARRLYRQSMKQLHPDKFGSHEQATALNMAWCRIKKLYAKRGLTLP